MIDFKFFHFFGNPSRPASESRRQRRRSRACRIEELENREMLSVTPWSLAGEGFYREPETVSPTIVIPAKAGIQTEDFHTISLDPRLHGGDENNDVANASPAPLVVLAPLAAAPDGYNAHDWACFEAINDLLPEGSTPIDKDDTIIVLWIDTGDGKRLEMLNIQELSLSGSLDLSDCTELAWLDCYDNQLTELNVSGCSALASLDCSGNELTKLNISGCDALEALWCSDNQLTVLNVSDCTALEELYCSNNQLDELDVSDFVKLKRVLCSGNELTKLNVAGCDALTRLNCSDNQLKFSTLPASKPDYSLYEYDLQKEVQIPEFLDVEEPWNILASEYCDDHTTYTWYYTNDNEPVSDALYDNNEGVFTFHGLKDGDEIYCIMTNHSQFPDLEELKTTTITVHAVAEDPKITAHPVSAIYTQGQSAVALSVTATGNGYLTYQWYKDDVAISGATARTYTPLTTTIGSAEYYCVVTNTTLDGPAKTARSNTATITVNAPGTLPDADVPMITAHPQPATYAQNDIADPLFVTASGNGTLTYQWYKDGGAIAGATSETYTPSTETVGIAHYYCVVKNTSGGTSETTTSNTAIITVSDASDAQPNIPTITEHPESATYMLNDIADALSVTATGNGTLTYQWYKDGEAITGAILETYVPSTETVGSAEYYCIVTNTLNDQTKTATSDTATITVKDGSVTKPDTPTGLKIDSKTHVSVTLSWNNVDGAASYELRYRVHDLEQDDEEGWEAPSTSASPATIGDLIPGETYDFQVRAVNTAGESDWSDTLTVTMEEDVIKTKLDTPVFVDEGCFVGKPGGTEEDQDSSVTLTWTADSDASGFEVWIEIETGKWALWVGGTIEAGTDPDTKIATITGLPAGKTYNYCIRAIDDSGRYANSDFSENKTLTTTDAALTNKTAAAAAKAKVSAPKKTNTIGSITLNLSTSGKGAKAATVAEAFLVTARDKNKNEIACYFVDAAVSTEKGKTTGKAVLTFAGFFDPPGEDKGTNVPLIPNTKYTFTVKTINKDGNDKLKAANYRHFDNPTKTKVSDVKKSFKTAKYTAVKGFKLMKNSATLTSLTLQWNKNGFMPETTEILFTITPPGKSGEYLVISLNLHKIGKLVGNPNESVSFDDFEVVSVQGYTKKHELIADISENATLKVYADLDVSKLEIKPTKPGNAKTAYVYAAAIEGIFPSTKYAVKMQCTANVYDKGTFSKGKWSGGPGASAVTKKINASAFKYNVVSKLKVNSDKDEVFWTVNKKFDKNYPGGLAACTPIRYEVYTKEADGTVTADSLLLVNYDPAHKDSGRASVAISPVDWDKFFTGTATSTTLFIRAVHADDIYSLEAKVKVKK